MNILCVGNSFAVDAATYVHQIAEAAGKDVFIAVLYIGGCSIERHWDNYQSGDKEYEFYINGSKTPEMWCSIHEGLAYKDWDFITFQQRSGDSCDSTTFFPELTLLTESIRLGTNAKFLLHKTWAYSSSFSHDRYGSNPMDQNAMANDIEKAYDEVSKITKIKYIIPSGTAITKARSIFGDKLDRDGYHLNEMGRTLSALVWCFFLMGTNIDVSKFKPTGYTYDDVTPPVNEENLKKLIDIAKETVINNKKHNL